MITTAYYNGQLIRAWDVLAEGYRKPFTTMAVDAHAAKLKMLMMGYRVLDVSLHLG